MRVHIYMLMHTMLDFRAGVAIWLRHAYVRIVRNKRFGSEHDRLWESGSCESLLQRMAACGYTMRDGLMQQL